jgi:hypothetical protein
MDQSHCSPGKEARGVIMSVYFRKLNDSCLHEPFPIPFKDKVLENVGG